MLQELQQRAYMELQNQVREQELLPADSMSVEILSEVYDQFLEAESDVLHLTMRITATGTAVDRANANLLAYEALKDRIPSTHQVQSEEITFNLDETTLQMDGRAVVMSVSASAPLLVEVDKAEVRSLVSGLTVDEATEALASSLSLSAPPKVEVRPDWIKRWKFLDRVPFVPFRIQVLVLE
jgi:hypothetical protein